MNICFMQNSVFQYLSVKIAFKNMLVLPTLYGHPSMLQKENIWKYLKISQNFCFFFCFCKYWFIVAINTPFDFCQIKILFEQTRIQLDSLKYFFFSNILDFKFIWENFTFWSLKVITHQNMYKRVEIIRISFVRNKDKARINQIRFPSDLFGFIIFFLLRSLLIYWKRTSEYKA